MAKNDNISDLLKDVADAIRAKKGTTDLINPQDFSSEIESIESGGGSDGGSTTSRWTGHVDVEGLKAIGWTDEDIAHYQENGVNWNEEDDEYHKVTEDNKALYGVLTADNISDYKEKITYLPKIDTSTKTSMKDMFSHCKTLIAIPILDTSNVTNMNYMFEYCYALKYIPQLNTSNVTSMSGMFKSCYAIECVPQLDTSNVTNMSAMFQDCHALSFVPLFDTSKVTNMSYAFYQCTSLASIPQFNTSKVGDMSSMFFSCNALVSCPPLDAAGVIFDSYLHSIFANCNALCYVLIKNLKEQLDLRYSDLICKESLLYIIRNEASSSSITISLSDYTKEKLANDADVVAALAEHPNISLA